MSTIFRYFCYCFEFRAFRKSKQTSFWKTLSRKITIFMNPKRCHSLPKYEDWISGVESEGNHKTNTLEKLENRLLVCQNGDSPITDEVQIVALSDLNTMFWHHGLRLIFFWICRRTQQVEKSKTHDFMSNLLSYLIKNKSCQVVIFKSAEPAWQPRTMLHSK